MGLYDREYAQSNQTTSHAYAGETQVVAFVKETYKLFAASMMAGAAGAYVGIPFAQQINSMSILLFILEIGLLIGLQFVKNKPGINLAVMFAFTFMTGITLAPLLSMAMVIDSAAIGNAFAMTSVVFGSMSLFAIKTTKDFTSYGKPLMIALFVVIGFSIVNMFLGNPMISIMLSGAVVMLFSVLIVYDTQNIIRGNYEHPIDGAIALYLDFLNIFTALLQLILAFNGDDD